MRGITLYRINISNYSISLKKLADTNIRIRFERSICPACDGYNYVLNPFIRIVNII